jgi:indole-3-glycerol phosphate synthase
VHDAEELKRAANAGARFIGVNNRDLKTMNVSLDTSFRLAGQAPAGSVLVSESGIAGAADVRRLKEAGYHGVLVGEHLLRQQDLQAAVRDLMATVWASS